MSRKSERKPGQLPSGNYQYKLYIGKDAAGKKQYKSFTASTMNKAKKAAAEWQSTHQVMNLENFRNMPLDAMAL